MLNQFPVAAVLPTTDVKRAKEFYTKKIGLREKQMGPGGELVLEAGAGTVLLVYERPAVKVEHTQAGFWVKDVEAEVKELRGKGVKFEEYDMPGIKTVNGIADFDGVKPAWFKDPDGNILAISQM